MKCSNCGKSACDSCGHCSCGWSKSDEEKSKNQGDAWKGFGFPMEWINFEKERPPIGEDVLVLKTYLDAKFDERGYHPDQEFWTKPIMQIDCFWSDNRWHNGGKAIHWMPLPELPNE